MRSVQKDEKREHGGGVLQREWSGPSFFFIFNKPVGKELQNLISEQRAEMKIELRLTDAIDPFNIGVCYFSKTTGKALARY